MLDRAVVTLDLAVALWVVGTRTHMRHAANPYELLKVFADELGAIIRDDARRLVRVFLSSTLKDRLDIKLLHLLANLPVHNTAAIPVDYRGHVVEGAADIQVRDVDVPVSMRALTLLKTAAFALGTVRLAGFSGVEFGSRGGH